MSGDVPAVMLGNVRDVLLRHVRFVLSAPGVGLLLASRVSSEFRGVSAARWVVNDAALPSRQMCPQVQSAGAPYVGANSDRGIRTAR